MIPIVMFVYKNTLYGKGLAEVPYIRLDIDNEIYDLQTYFDAAGKDVVPLKDFDCRIQR